MYKLPLSPGFPQPFPSDSPRHGGSQEAITSAPTWQGSGPQQCLDTEQEPAHPNLIDQSQAVTLLPMTAVGGGQVT